MFDKRIELLEEVICKELPYENIEIIMEKTKNYNLLKKLELLEDEKIQNELLDVLNIGKN